MDNTEARKDFLTGFYTRESLVRSINTLRTEYETYKKAFSLLLIDIDNFKMFNDKYGHLLGDEVLKYFASSIRLDLIAEQTALFRFGGDELLVLFHAADSEEAYPIAARMLDNIKRRPCNLRGVNLKMSFSGGIASYPKDAWTAEDLLERADKALYASKRNGRGQITLYRKIWIKRLKVWIVLSSFFLGATLLGVAIHLNFDLKIRQATHRVFAAAKKVETAFTEAVKHVKAAQAQAQKSPAFKKPSENQSSAPKKFFSDEPVAPKAPPPPPKPSDTIYLKNGGVIRGRILSQDEHTLTVQWDVREGRGSMVLKKENVDRIEPAS